MMFGQEMQQDFPVDLIEAEAIEAIDFEEVAPVPIHRHEHRAPQPGPNAKELEQLLRQLEREERKPIPTRPKKGGD